ncbi:tyrosine-protein phosphatase [Fibrella aquatica]|uniref:tyrosine-protein phosphatase n=1 Tax=Fibrella aquatica TaxID=3242487 RepID=UPI003521F56F
MRITSLWHRLFPTRSGSTDQPVECPWQVDMHSHLIPDIDDGVKSLDETLICLKQFAEWGIRKVITTPHVSRDWYPNTPAIMQEGLARVQALIDEHQLPITLELAAEYLLDDFFIEQLNRGELLTFGEKRYLLVETGWSAPPYQLTDMLFRIQTRGYVPVLAHPERYKYYHTDREALAQLRETGCLFQLNWMSLSGRYGSQVERQARFLLERKWVSFIGSDLHRSHDLKTMKNLLNQADLQLLSEQPLLNTSLLD